MNKKSEGSKNASRKPEGVGIISARMNRSGAITAAIILATAAIIAAVIGANYSNKKEQTAPLVVAAVSPMPQVLPNPLIITIMPSPAAPAPATSKTTVQRNSVQNANQINATDLSSNMSQNSSSWEERSRDKRDKKEETLNGYIQEYRDKYSSIDQTVIPCDSEEKKLKNSADALLGLIESLGTELNHKQALSTGQKRIDI